VDRAQKKGQKCDHTERRAFFFFFKQNFGGTCSVLSAKMNLPHPSLGDNHITRKITHGKTQENQRNWLFLTKQLLRMKKLNFNLCDQAEHSKSRPQLVIGVVPNPKNANNDKRRLDFFGASSSKIKNGAICAGFIL